MMRTPSRFAFGALFALLALSIAPLAFAQAMPSGDDIPTCSDDLPTPTYNTETQTWENPCNDVVVIVGRDKFTFKDLVYEQIIPFIDGYLIQALYALAFAFFIYGMFKFFFTGGEENRQRGRQFAVWGIIGFVVLFSVWSLVMLLLQSFAPNNAWNGRTPVGNVPPGGRCSSGTQCQSGVCTLRGINTSTCE